MKFFYEKRYVLIILAALGVALLPRDMVNFYGALGIQSSFVHMTGFFIISLASVKLFRGDVFRSLVFTLSFCFISEILQEILCSTRAFEWIDIQYNLYGILLAHFVYALQRNVTRLMFWKNRRLELVTAKDAKFTKE